MTPSTPLTAPRRAPRPATQPFAFPASPKAQPRPRDASSGVGVAAGRLGPPLADEAPAKGPSEWPVASIRTPPPPASDDDRTLPADGIGPASMEPTTIPYTRDDAASAPSQPSIPGPPQAPVFEDARALERAEERIKTLTTRAVGLRSRLDEAEAAVRQRDADLARLTSQHESLRALIAVRADRIRELEAIVAERDRLLAEDAQRLGEVRERLDAREAGIRERDARIDALTAKLAAAEEALAQRKEPDRPDDLRAIRGIGPKLESRLHAHGITRYAQIAAWGEDDVAAIAAALGIHPKRILRDDWVTSAQALLPSRPPDPAPGEGGAPSPSSTEAPRPEAYAATDGASESPVPEAEPTAPSASIPPPDVDGVDDAW